MSSSDVRLFADLVGRVEALEKRVMVLEEHHEAKDLQSELYGEEVNHTADREERAELRRGPGRPPKASF